MLTNRWLSRQVKQRTEHLERESAERRKVEEALQMTLTDQTMPTMTGLVLIDRLRELSSSVRFVLMSGFSPSIEGRDALEMRIGALLSKPFTRGELAAAIHTALGGQPG